MMDINELINKITCADCMDILKELPDKCIELALCDPPYGIDYGKQLKGKGDGKGGSDKYGWRNWNVPEWDKERPPEEIFKEILRVSKNQIIWGGVITLRTCCQLPKVGLFGIRCKEILAWQMVNLLGLLLTEHCEYSTYQEQKPFKMGKYTQRKSHSNLYNGAW